MVLYFVYSHLKESPQRESRNERLIREMMETISNSTSATNKLLEIVDKADCKIKEDDLALENIKCRIESIARKLEILRTQVDNKDTNLINQLILINEDLKTIKEKLNLEGEKEK